MRVNWPTIAATAPLCLRVRSGDEAAGLKAPKLVDGSISLMLMPAANILHNTRHVRVRRLSARLHTRNTLSGVRQFAWWTA